MYDALVTWKKTKTGKVQQAHYIMGEPTKRAARSTAIELHDLDEGRVLERRVVVVRAKSKH